MSKDSIDEPDMEEDFDDSEDWDNDVYNEDEFLKDRQCPLMNGEPCLTKHCGFVHNYDKHGCPFKIIPKISSTLEKLVGKRLNKYRGRDNRKRNYDSRRSY